MSRNRDRIESTKGIIRVLESVVEVAVLAVVYYLVWRHGYGSGIFPNYFGKGKYVLMGVYGILVYALMGNIDGFAFGNLRRLDLGIAQWISLVLANFITYFQLCLIANKMISPLPLIVAMMIQAVLVVGFIYLYAAIYHKLYAPHNMIMIYGANNSESLKIKLDSRKDKYKVRCMISVGEGLEKICQEIVKYDAVLLNDIPAQIRNDILKFCYERKIRVYLVPKISDILLRGAKNISVFDTPIVMVKGVGLSPDQRFAKRAMDIILCAIALIVASPVLLIVAAAIKLEDGGPVFYKQKRVTLNNREFDILKFRSMIVNAEKEGKSIPATDNDPRITKVGKVIRATRIDELPQIINILKGDMSIVGPRPERTEHVEKYTKEIPEFGYRLKVKGGLTGYAQIYGKYNTTAYDKLRLDLMYIENYSVLLDIKLILLTLRIIFKKESTDGFAAPAAQPALQATEENDPTEDDLASVGK